MNLPELAAAVRNWATQLTPLGGELADLFQHLDAHFQDHGTQATQPPPNTGLAIDGQATPASTLHLQPPAQPEPNTEPEPTADTEPEPEQNTQTDAQTDNTDAPDAEPLEDQTTPDAPPAAT